MSGRNAKFLRRVRAARAEIGHYVEIRDLKRAWRRMTARQKGEERREPLHILHLASIAKIDRHGGDVHAVTRP